MRACASVKARRFLVSVSLVLILAAVVFMLSYSPPWSSESEGGSHGAYFVDVKHPDIAYQGRNVTWSVTLYNKNCTTGNQGSGSFFLKLYLDGELWSNEFDSMNHTTWNCNLASQVKRHYTARPWYYTPGPVVYDMKLELYWYNGNASYLQDTTSFLIPVASYATASNLIVFSYFAVYVMALGLLGFFMLTAEPIVTSIRPKSTALQEKGTDSLKSVNVHSRFGESFPFLYLFALVTSQATMVSAYVFSFDEALRQFLYFIVLTVQCTFVFLIMKRENLNFRKYGYRWPSKTGKYLVSALLVAVVYSLITIFVPGSLEGFYVFPFASESVFFSTIMFALLASIASETIFRGYILRKLTRKNGFLFALLATSLMFALYRVALMPLNLSNILTDLLSVLALGLFLGLAFYRTRTLLWPIIFYSTISILGSLTPLKALAPSYAGLLLEFVGLAISSVMLFAFTIRVGEER